MFHGESFLSWSLRFISIPASEKTPFISHPSASVVPSARTCGRGMLSRCSASAVWLASSVALRRSASASSALTCGIVVDSARVQLWW